MDNKTNPPSSTSSSNMLRPLRRGRIKNPASKPPRARILRPRPASAKVVETIILSSDSSSSSSDDEDEDYLKFLSTLEPDEEYPGTPTPSSEDEDSQISELSNSDSKDEGTRVQGKP
ncbi:unnamed protein product [Trifolium pratense]|uniref:Uncharacterized protein n=1 Tax=Trifolium pratense TaxID=57577 RepID=A0ACB0MBM8_TRIPR|nr:unnamed protein product [Trifolium pratense]